LPRALEFPTFSSVSFKPNERRDKQTDKTIKETNRRLTLGQMKINKKMQKKY